MKFYLIAALIFCLTSCLKSPPKAKDSAKVDIDDFKVNLEISAERTIDNSQRGPTSSPPFLLKLFDKTGNLIKLNQTIGQDELSIYMDSTPTGYLQANCGALGGSYFCGYSINPNIDYLIGQHQLRIELTRKYQLVASVEFNMPGAIELTSPSRPLKSISTGDLPLLVEWTTSYQPTQAKLYARNTECGGERDISISSGQTYLALTLDELTASPPYPLCAEYAKVSLNLTESSNLSPSLISGFDSAQAQWNITNSLELNLSP